MVTFRPLTVVLCLVGCAEPPAGRKGAPASGDSGTPTLLLAVTDHYAGTAGEPLVVAAAQGLLANDQAPAGAVVRVVRPPRAGAVVLDADGGFSYTSERPSAFTDQLRYAVDADGDTSEAEVTLAFVDPPPVVASDDGWSTPEDTLLRVAAPGVLANDAGGLRVSLRGFPTRGEVHLRPDGAFTYRPALDWHGTDRFTYALSDGTREDLATVTVAVTPVHDPLVAVDDRYTTDEDAVLRVRPPGVLANDPDPDGRPRTVRLVTPGTLGDAVVFPDGGLEYTPHADVNGEDRLEVAVDDGRGEVASTVVVTVRPVNDRPVAVDDAYSVRVGEWLHVSPRDGVLANDTDIDDDFLFLKDVRFDLFYGGEGTFYGTGSFSFLGDVVGRNVFTYRVADMTDGLAHAELVIDVVE